jgi:hypothetical protein
MKIPTCFDPQGIIIRDPNQSNTVRTQISLSVKACFRDAVTYSIGSGNRRSAFQALCIYLYILNIYSCLYFNVVYNVLTSISIMSISTYTTLLQRMSTF